MAQLRFSNDVNEFLALNAGACSKVASRYPAHRDDVFQVCQIALWKLHSKIDPNNPGAVGFVFRALQTAARDYIRDQGIIRLPRWTQTASTGGSAMPEHKRDLRSGARRVGQALPTEVVSLSAGESIDVAEPVNPARERVADILEAAQTALESSTTQEERRKWCRALNAAECILVGDTQADAGRELGISRAGAKHVLRVLAEC